MRCLRRLLLCMPEASNASDTTNVNLNLKLLQLLLPPSHPSRKRTLGRLLRGEQRSMRIPRAKMPPYNSRDQICLAFTALETCQAGVYPRGYVTAGASISSAPAR